MRTLRAAALVLLAGSLLLGTPALAQERVFNVPQGTGGAFGPPHVSGIRATITDITGLDVTIDVTELYVTNAAWTFGTAWIGVASTIGFFPLFPAVDWGDGATVPWAGYGAAGTGIPISAYNTTVNGVPAHVYVGSFSHTYGAEVDYTVTVNSVNGVGTTAGQAPTIATGSLVGSVTPTFGDTYYFVRNTTTVPLAPSASATIEIDTVSDLGLLILALVLAASAVVMLKR